MATHGGHDHERPGGKLEPADWLDHAEDHYQRSSFNSLVFLLFPLIAIYSVAAAWFGWW